MAVALRTAIIRQRAESFHFRVIVRVAHARGRRMFEAFCGVTRLEREVFIDNSAPACRVFIDQNPQHPCEIVCEMPGQYLRESLTEPFLWVAVPVMIDAFEGSFAG